MRIQDAAGNDVGHLRERERSRNRSTVTGVPGAPTGLTATKAAGANRGTQIDLAWDEPSDTGLSQISGYRIEWSADGNAPWADLVPDTGSTDRTHSDSGLPSPTTRHYRVSAINGNRAPAARPAPPTPPPTIPWGRCWWRRGLAVGSNGNSLFFESADGIAFHRQSAFTVSADDGTGSMIGNAVFF